MLKGIFCILLLIAVIFFAVLLLTPQGPAMCTTAVNQGVAVVKDVCKATGK